MNAEKKTQCFPYGPCAVGVNYYTGARLSDILKLAGCKSYADGARYECISRMYIAHIIPGYPRDNSHLIHMHAPHAVTCFTLASLDHYLSSLSRPSGGDPEVIHRSLNHGAVVTQ